MFPLDEDDEGEVSFGEQSDAEREMTPDIPKAPSVKSFDDDGDFEGASDVDSGTLRSFVVAVIYANTAVLLVALGPMLWYFEGWTQIGVGLLVLGILAGVRTYQTYRAWQRDRDAAESAEAGDAAETADPAATPDSEDTTATADGADAVATADETDTSPEQ